MRTMDSRRHGAAGVLGMAAAAVVALAAVVAYDIYSQTTSDMPRADIAGKWLREGMAIYGPSSAADAQK